MQDDTTTHICVKSNRSFFIKILVVFLAILSVVVVAAVVLVVCGKREGWLEVMAAFGVWIVLTTIAILILKFYKGKWYEFSKNEIICYKRKKVIDRINVPDILQMIYEKFKLKQAASILLEGIVSEASDYAARHIHILMRDRTQKKLGSFSEKDVLMLKENLYGDLIHIKTSLL